MATIEDPSMKPPPPSQGVIIEQIADGDDVAPRPSTLLSLRMNRNQRLSRNPTKMTGLISLSVISYQRDSLTDANEKKHSIIPNVSMYLQMVMNQLRGTQLFSKLMSIFNLLGMRRIRNSALSDLITTLPVKMRMCVR